MLYLSKCLINVITWFLLISGLLKRNNLSLQRIDIKSTRPKKHGPWDMLNECPLRGAGKYMTQHNHCFLVFSDLDLSLSPTGKVVKTVGDTLTVKMEKSASGDAHMSWTKVMGAGVGR